jgi:hypothetical protein
MSGTNGPRSSPREPEMISAATRRCASLLGPEEEEIAS